MPVRVPAASHALEDVDATRGRQPTRSHAKSRVDASSPALSDVLASSYASYADIVASKAGRSTALCHSKECDVGQAESGYEYDSEGKRQQHGLVHQAVEVGSGLVSRSSVFSSHGNLHGKRKRKVRTRTWCHVGKDQCSFFVDETCTHGPSFGLL